MISTQYGKKMTTKAIIELVKKQQPYFKNGGGITISGGEPTLQSKELIKLFTELKKIGIHTALDTNGGIINPDVKKLYDLTDLVLMDLKHIDPKQHLALTGQSNSNTLKLIAYREKTKKPMWLRYVLVPGYSDKTSDLKNWAQQLKIYKQIERIEILPYHNLGEYKYKELGMEYKLKDVKPPTLEQIKKTQKIFLQNLKNVFIR